MFNLDLTLNLVDGVTILKFIPNPQTITSKCYLIVPIQPIVPRPSLVLLLGSGKTVPLPKRLTENVAGNTENI